MDFTEVYSEFVDAAKLPDEVSTLSEIQGKIQDYYDIHTSQ
jgi:conjugal transfer mating pair stabilization protein TraN